MRRRMQELAAGVYQQEGPKLKLNLERLELSAGEGENISGSFLMESANQVLMRGVVLSDNPRMVVLNPEFSGTAAKINYEFHTEGMVEGDIQKGSLIIILNKNEYTLSFVVSICQPVLTVEEQELRTLQDFAELSKRDYEKAYEVFTSPLMEAFLKKQSMEVRLLARSLVYPEAPGKNMEEFLLSCGLKAPVSYECCFDNYVYENPTEDIREVLEILRQGWGYTEVNVYTEGGFLAVTKLRFLEEDFIGNSCRVPVFLLADKLHRGINHGRVVVNCDNHIFSYHVTVHQKDMTVGSFYDEDKEEKKTLAQLIELYVRFRTGKIMSATWGYETLNCLNHILADKKEHILFLLAKAQVLILSDRSQEAQWILDQCRYVLKDTDSVAYGFYLYITTLLNSEKEYLHKVAGELQRLHMQHREEPLIFWLLLFTGGAYENNLVRKYRAIKGFCLLYTNSPVFYAEAFCLVKERPSLLDEGGEFEVRLLHWAYKHELLTKELGQYLALETSFIRNYYPLYTPVLKYYYETYGGEENLSALCSHYISGGIYKPEVLPYYEQAMEKNLKIYGLFEAYVRCACEANKLSVTPMMQYYLPFIENLPYEQQAALYALVIRNRDRHATLYFQCKNELEQFALEQLAAGHMDENLGVIYDFYFSQVPLTQELAKQLAPLLYVHKLYVEDERMKWVVVVNRQLDRISRYPIVSHVAYFPIYAKERVIAFEDGYQNRYVKSVEYDLMLLMPSDSLTRKCLRLTQHEMAYLIHYFDYERLTEGVFLELTEQEMEGLRILMDSEVMTKEYKQYLVPVLLRFYKEQERYEELDICLMEFDFSAFHQSLRNYACERMIERELYEKAFEGVVSYGCTSISVSLLLRLCTSMIEKKGREEDADLVALCSMVFERGKFNQSLLEYLVNTMVGSTRRLYELWVSATDFQVQTYSLEERLLAQMMFTDVFVSRSDEVLASYMKGGGKRLLLDAYLSYFAYQYFVREAPVNAMVMNQLLIRFKRGERLHLCLKFALLSYLCEEKIKEYGIMQQLYDDFILKGYVFAFYEKLPAEVTAHFPRYGKKVIEYRTGKKKRITMRFLHTDYAGNNILKKEYQFERMEEMYEGIYIKEVTLFYGDTVQYYISEDKDDVSNIVSSGQISERNISGQGEEGCLGIINSMIISEQLGEHQVFEMRLNEYDRLVEQAAKEFVWVK